MTTKSVGKRSKRASLLSICSFVVMKRRNLSGGRSSDEKRERAMEELLRTKLRYVTGNKLLDADCGTGQLACCLAAQGVHVLGISSHARDVLKARKLARRNKVQKLTRFRQGSTDSLQGLEDNSFDAVYAVATLGGSSTARNGLRAIYRLLKPGGRLCIVDTEYHGVHSLTASHSQSSVVEHDPIRHWPVFGSFAAWLASIGFQGIEQEDIPDDAPAGRMLREPSRSLGTVARLTSLTSLLDGRSGRRGVRPSQGHGRSRHIVVTAMKPLDSHEPVTRLVRARSLSMHEAPSTCTQVVTQSSEAEDLIGTADKAAASESTVRLDTGKCSSSVRSTSTASLIETMIADLVDSPARIVETKEAVSPFCLHDGRSLDAVSPHGSHEARAPVPMHRIKKHHLTQITVPRVGPLKDWRRLSFEPLDPAMDDPSIVPVTASVYKSLLSSFEDRPGPSLNDCLLAQIEPEQSQYRRDSVSGLFTVPLQGRDSFNDCVHATAALQDLLRDCCPSPGMTKTRPWSSILST